MTRILVDENVPIQLLPHLAAAGHQAEHVDRLGLKGISNGELLAHAARERYAVLLTGDTKMGGSQNIAAHDIAVVLIRGRKTPKRLPALVPALLAAIASVPRRTVTEVTAD